MDETAPDKPKIRASVSCNQVNLSWNTPRDNVQTTGYIGRILSGNTVLEEFETMMNSYQSESLEAGKYRIEISSVDAAGNISKPSVSNKTIRADYFEILPLPISDFPVVAFSETSLTGTNGDVSEALRRSATLA